MNLTNFEINTEKNVTQNETTIGFGKLRNSQLILDYLVFACQLTFIINFLLRENA